MYNVAKKDEFLKQFIINADANLELVKTYGSLAGSMRKDDADMVKYLIKEATRVVASSVPDGLDVPDVAVYTSQSGDENSINVVDLVLRNKHSSGYEFRFKKQLVVSDDVFEVLSDFIKCSWVELISDALIRANLEVVNDKLAEIGKEAGNNFVVKIVSPMGRDGRKVIKITDEEIVFVADESRILNMDDILIFNEPNEFLSEEVIKKGYTDTVALFAKAQTTPQFLGVHEPLVGYICDISKMVKPSTLIKKVYSKNVAKLRSDKESLAYFNDGKVFSVLSVNSDGKEVVLKPFNIDTLEVEDYDVLKAI